MMGLILCRRKTALLYLIVSFLVFSGIGYCFKYGLPGFKENDDISSITYDRLKASTPRKTYKLVGPKSLQTDATRFLDLYIAKFKMYSVNQNPQSIRERRKFVQNEVKPFQAVNVVAHQFGMKQLDSIVSQKQFIVCPVYELWKHNRSSQIPQHFQECHKMSFRSSGPVTLLASYPGSGNSWVRQLIETATGIYTGSVYCDPSYVASGMIGEGLRTGNVVVVKTHFSKINSSKIIYIIRNPFDAIVAEWSRFLTRRNMEGRHVSEIGNEHFGKYCSLQSITMIESCHKYICRYGQPPLFHNFLAVHLFPYFFIRSSLIQLKIPDFSFYLFVY